MKAMLKSLEAVLAILMILTVFLITYSTNVPIPEFESLNKQIRGFNALKTLDDNNELRQYAVINDTTTIQKKLLNLIPAEIQYEVQICSFNCSKSANISTSKLVAVPYILAGTITNATYTQIILFMG